MLYVNINLIIFILICNSNIVFFIYYIIIIALRYTLHILFFWNLTKISINLHNILFPPKSKSYLYGKIKNFYSFLFFLHLFFVYFENSNLIVYWEVSFCLWGNGQFKLSTGVYVRAQVLVDVICRRKQCGR